MVDNWPSGAYKWNLCNGICLLPRLEAGKNLTWTNLCADQVTELQLRVVTVTVLSGPKRPWNIWTQLFLISVFLTTSLLPQTQDWGQRRWIKSGISQERRALESLWECVQGRSMVGGRYMVQGTKSLHRLFCSKLKISFQTSSQHEKPLRGPLWVQPSWPYWYHAHGDNVPPSPQLITLWSHDHSLRGKRNSLCIVLTSNTLGLGESTERLQPT